LLIDLAQSTQSLLISLAFASHTTESSLFSATGVVHYTNALLLTSLTGSSNTDTLIVGSNRYENYTDTRLLLTRTAISTTDSVLFKTNDNNFTTDALVISNRFFSHHTEARLQIGLVEVNHTADALLSGQKSVSNNTNALLRGRSSKNTTTNSKLASYLNLFHYTDVLLFAAYTGQSVIRFKKFILTGIGSVLNPRVATKTILVLPKLKVNSKGSYTPPKVQQPNICNINRRILKDLYGYGIVDLSAGLSDCCANNPDCGSDIPVVITSTNEFVVPMPSVLLKEKLPAVEVKDTATLPETLINFDIKPSIIIIANDDAGNIKPLPNKDVESIINKDIQTATPVKEQIKVEAKLEPQPLFQPKSQFHVNTARPQRKNTVKAVIQSSAKTIEAQTSRKPTIVKDLVKSRDNPVEVKSPPRTRSSFFTNDHKKRVVTKR
jgi:hypothetical protein